MLELLHPGHQNRTVLLFPEAMSRYYGLRKTKDVNRYYALYVTCAVIQQQLITNSGSGESQSFFATYEDLVNEDSEDPLQGLVTVRLLFEVTKYWRGIERRIFTGDSITIRKREINFVQIVRTLLNFLHEEGSYLAEVTVNPLQPGTLTAIVWS